MKPEGLIKLGNKQKSMLDKIKKKRLEAKKKLLQTKNTLKEQSEKLANLFKKIGIKNVLMTAAGNSLSAGYTFPNKEEGNFFVDNSTETIPLLYRSGILYQIFESNNIHLIRKHFSRAANNSDGATFSSIFNNEKLSSVFAKNREDYSGVKYLPSTSVSNEDMNLFYPKTVVNDIGFKDLLKKSDENTANILVYNGGTGEFLDTLTRGGQILKFQQAIKNDFNSIEGILKMIQEMNRDGSNTQIYICGVPNFSGIYLSELINQKFKNLAAKYPFVTYVEPVKSKFIYDKQGFTGKILDIHYDNREYIEFNANIVAAINSNYVINQQLIDVDREFCRLSKKIEDSPVDMGDEYKFLIRGKKGQLSNEENLNLLEEFSNLKELNEEAMLKVMEAFKKVILYGKKGDATIFLKKLRNHLLLRIPTDFFYVSKVASKIKKLH